MNCGGIENHLQCNLDVTFRKDNCRARVGYVVENFATLRKRALQIVQERTDKLSLRKEGLRLNMIMVYLKQI